MAKSIDTTKLERIKESTVALVVSHGYYAASVSQIAKRAGVADGYLYRFYPSKYELVSDIFKNKVEGIVQLLQGLLDEQKSVRQIVYDFVSFIMRRAQEAPEQMKFLFMLIHDYNFEIDKGVADQMRTTFGRLLKMGQESREISSTTTTEDLYVLIIGQSLLYIDSRYRNHFGHEEFDSSMVERVSSLCLKAIN